MTRREGAAGQHLDGGVRRLDAAAGIGQALPCGQEGCHGARRQRLHLIAQSSDASATDAPEHVAIAPLGARGSRSESTRRDLAHRLKPTQSLFGDRGAEAESVGDIVRGEGAVCAGEPRDQVRERVRGDVEERVRDARRQRHTEGVAQSAGVLDRSEVITSSDAHRECATGIDERGCPRFVDTARRPLVGVERADDAQQVGDVLRVPRRWVPPADGTCDGIDGIGIEQVAQGRRTKELAEEVGVEGERGRATLGKRGISFVEKGGDVAKDKGLREGGRLLGDDVNDRDASIAHLPEEFAQRRHVVHIEHALAHGLEHHGEVRVAGGDGEQVGRSLALLPQRAALARHTPGEKQGARGALAEPPREERRSAHLALHDVTDVLGVYGKEFGDRHGVLVQGVREADDDAVIGVHDLRLDAVLGEQALADRQCPWRVHASTEGRVDRNPPVAEFVAEPLDHHGSVVRQGAGRRALLLEVGDQIVDGPCVQAGVREALAGGLGVAGGAQEFPDRASELDRSADGITVPERQLGGLPRSGGDPHAIGRDLLDPPRRCPEREDVPDARLIDHLFIELAHARGRPDEVDGVEPAIGDRATAGDRETLGAGARGDLTGASVPHDARLEFSEVVTGVLAGEHVEDGDVGVMRQVAVRRGPANEVIELLDVPGVHGHYGHDLLGEDVERIGGDAERFYRPGAHAVDDDRRLEEITAILREDHAAADGADLVTCAADALQAARHRRR